MLHSLSVRIYHHSNHQANDHPTPPPFLKNYCSAASNLTTNRAGAAYNVNTLQADSGVCSRVECVAMNQISSPNLLITEPVGHSAFIQAEQPPVRLASATGLVHGLILSAGFWMAGLAAYLIF